MKVKEPELHHCFNCGQDTYQVKMYRCFPCYNYLHRTGSERPAELYRVTTICENPNCNRPLATDPNARKRLCNACYAYKLKHNINRPIKLCRPPNTRGWCSCGNQIILTDSEIKNNFLTSLCFVCRSRLLPTNS